MGQVFNLAKNNLSPTASANIIRAIGADVQRDFDKNLFIKNAMNVISPPRSQELMIEEPTTPIHTGYKNISIGASESYNAKVIFSGNDYIQTQRFSNVQMDKSERHEPLKQVGPGMIYASQEISFSSIDN